MTARQSSIPELLGQKLRVVVSFRINSQSGPL